MSFHRVMTVGVLIVASLLNATAAPAPVLPVSVKTVEAQQIVVIRSLTTARQLSRTLDQDYELVREFMAQNDLTASGPPVAIFHKYSDEIDVEAGFPVSGNCQGRGNVLVRTLPAGEVAVVELHDASRGMRPAYDALSAWMKSTNHRPNGLPWNVYPPPTAGTRGPRSIVIYCPFK